MKDPRAWKNFWKTFVGAFAFGVLGFALVLVLIDPYRIFSFSPDWDRAPMAQNQRFSYPSIARDPQFDSLVIGTSTSRIFQPSVLNQELDSSFAILSMNSATGYEQFKIFEQFVKSRQRVKHLVIGMDAIWCALPDHSEKYTSRPFPEWMYDDNPYNDFVHHFTFKTLETVLKQGLYMLGLRAPTYGKDGYQNFLLPDSEYDLKTAQFHLYGPKGPRMPQIPSAPIVLSDAQQAQYTFPNHQYLAGIFELVSPETVVSVVNVPYHHFNQPVKNTRSEYKWSTCFQGINEIIRDHPNTQILDFMIPSSFTKKDENYWDRLHYRLQPSFELTREIVYGITHRRENDNGLFKLRYSRIQGSDE